MSPPVVHLELHTPDLGAARDFLRGVLGWRACEVATPVAPYVSIDLGLSGGIVACGTRTAMWLPYVEVDDVETATARARDHGARTVLAPRSGPQGRRSVVRSPAAGDLAFWQATCPPRRRPGTTAGSPTSWHRTGQRCWRTATG